MKHKFGFAATCFLLLFATFGCSFLSDSNKEPADARRKAELANKDLIDQAAELILGNEKTGVPQCDAVLEKLESQLSDDSNQATIADRAKREVVRQSIYKLVRDNITADSSAAEKKKIGERCQQIGAQFGE